MSKQQHGEASGLTTAQKEKNLSDKEIQDLISCARETRVRAYAPYSKFRVGAAIMTEDGSLVPGCNVENISYGLSICAERSAICRAIADGHRKFKAIAVIADMKERFVVPCGACRQFIGEFGLEIEIYLARPDGVYAKTTIEELMPDSFTPKWVDLEKLQSF